MKKAESYAVCGNPEAFDPERILRLLAELIEDQRGCSVQKAEVLCSDGQPVTPERKAAAVQEYVEQNRRIREAAVAAQKERSA